LQEQKLLEEKVNNMNFMYHRQDIDGYNDKYYACSDGRILSYNNREKDKRNNGSFLKPWISKGGYLYIRLWGKNGCSKNLSIHSLVAKTFIPNPGNKPQINHKDGNKMNNNVSNLEWCTEAENAQHSFNMGLNRNPVLYGESNGNSKLNKWQVQRIRLLKEVSNISYSKTAKIFNVSSRLISLIVNKKNWINI